MAWACADISIEIGDGGRAVRGRICVPHWKPPLPKGEADIEGISQRTLRWRRQS